MTSHREIQKRKPDVKLAMLRRRVDFLTWGIHKYAGCLQHTAHLSQRRSSRIASDDRQLRPQC